MKRLYTVAGWYQSLVPSNVYQNVCGACFVWNSLDDIIIRVTFCKWRRVVLSSAKLLRNQLYYIYSAHYMNELM